MRPSIQSQAKRLPRAEPTVGTGVPSSKNDGAHGKAGMESEEGMAFEFLPRRVLGEGF